MPYRRTTNSQAAAVKLEDLLSEDNLFEEKAVQASASRVRTINHALPEDSGKKLFPEAFDENRNPAQRRNVKEELTLEKADFGPVIIEDFKVSPSVPPVIQVIQEPVRATKAAQKLLPNATTPFLSVVKAAASPKAAHRRTPLTLQEKIRLTPAKAAIKPKPSPPVDILDDFQARPQVRRKVSLGAQESLQSTLSAKTETETETEIEEGTGKEAPSSVTSKSVRRTTPKAIRRKTSSGAGQRSALSTETTRFEVIEQSMEAELKPAIEETFTGTATETLNETATEVTKEIAVTPIAQTEGPVEMKQTSIDTSPKKPAANEPLVITIPAPPPIETLSLFDTAVLTELKENEKPFISDGDRGDIEAFLDSFVSLDISKFLIPVSIIGEGTFSTVYKVIDLNFYDCDNSKWTPFSRQNQLDYLRLWRWFFAQKETLAEDLILFKNGKRVEYKRPAKNQTGTSLYALIRTFFYDWAWRGLNALAKEVSIDKLDPAMLPALLQAKMYHFRPHFIALKRINATSSPQRILDEMSFLRELGGKDNVVPLISGYRCEDQIIVTFPYFYSEDFRDFLSNNSTFDIKNIANYMKSLFIALAHMHNHRVIHRDVKPSNFLYSNDAKDGPRAVLVDFGLAQKCASKHQQTFVPSKNGPTEKERRKLLAVDSLVTSFSQSIDCATVYDRAERVAMIMNHLGPGHFQNDPRAPMKASRAGTRGFRAPEVLFKCTNQSTSLDIWSAGVILLTLLTRRYPFFQSSDDLDAILEIACIFGHQEMATAAKIYGRKWVCAIPSIPERHITWPELCARLNPSFAPEIPPECFDLLACCLNLNAERRITARHALNHPFIKNYAI